MLDRTNLFDLDRRMLDGDKLFMDMCTFGACRINSAIDPIRATSLYDMSRELLALPQTELLRFVGPLEGNGYQRPGLERVVGTQPDAGRHFWRTGHDRNVPSDFPSAVPSAAELCNVTFRDLLAVGQCALGIIGNRLHKPDDYFARLTNGGGHGLRLLGYPRVAGTEGDIRFPPHRDFGLLTMFVGGADPGLELKLGDRWVAVENPPGSVIIAAGTVLKYETKGVIQQLVHQVRSVCSNRTSIVFFIEPHPDAILPTGERAADFYRRIVSKIYGET